MAPQMVNPIPRWRWPRSVRSRAGACRSFSSVTPRTRRGCATSPTGSSSGRSRPKRLLERARAVLTPEEGRRRKNSSLDPNGSRPRTRGRTRRKNAAPTERTEMGRGPPASRAGAPNPSGAPAPAGRPKSGGYPVRPAATLKPLVAAAPGGAAGRAGAWARRRGRAAGRAGRRNRRAPRRELDAALAGAAKPP